MQRLCSIQGVVRCCADHHIKQHASLLVSRPSILLGFNLAAVLPRWSALIYIYRLIYNQSKALIVYGMDYTGL